jgi:hypothetical protein
VHNRDETIVVFGRDGLFDWQLRNLALSLDSVATLIEGATFYEEGGTGEEDLPCHPPTPTQLPTVPPAPTATVPSTPMQTIALTPHPTVTSTPVPTMAITSEFTIAPRPRARMELRRSYLFTIAILCMG